MKRAKKSASVASSSDAVVVRSVSMDRAHYDLFGRDEGDGTWMEKLCKVDDLPDKYVELEKMVDIKDKEDQHSSQGVNLGIKIHPFNMSAAIAFKNQNVHHSACIEAKSRALTGLGFKDPLVAEYLDPLCDTTFKDVMDAIGEDWTQTGNGYMEVVYKDKKIVGLHHVPCASVIVCVEDVSYNKHYIVGSLGGEGISPRVMAPFGELADFLDRLNNRGKYKPNRPTKKNQPIEDAFSYQAFYSSYGIPSQRSEIIHFARKTSMSRWYGYPDWLSAVASIELIQMLTQERFDFFLNRGVPEVIIALTGATIDTPTWNKFSAALQATIGKGNQHKTFAFNINKPEVKLQVEKLAMQTTGDTMFASMSETVALDIVTAHRTPPLLAGIQIPGKLGAVNELPNALLAFQVLVIGPDQTTFTSILAETLGNQKKNTGLKVRGKHFDFKTIVEQIPLGLGTQSSGTSTQQDGTAQAGAGVKQMDTVSRMRTPAASAGGRDLSQGLKKAILDFIEKHPAEAA